MAFYAYPSDKTLEDGTTILFQLCSDETFNPDSRKRDDEFSLRLAESPGFY